MHFCRKYGIFLVSMVSPTSNKRIQMIAREGEGFIYCVSSMGVTGIRENIGDDVRKMVKLIKEVKDIPCAVGFGINTSEQAKNMSEYADGIIVGSRIVKIIGEYGQNCVPHVAEYVRMMKKAITVPNQKMAPTKAQTVPLLRILTLRLTGGFCTSMILEETNYLRL